MPDKGTCQWPGCISVLGRYSRDDYCDIHYHQWFELQSFEPEELERLGLARVLVAGDNAPRFHSAADVARLLAKTERTITTYFRKGILRGFHAKNSGAWSVTDLEWNRILTCLKEGKSPYLRVESSGEVEEVGKTDAGPARNFTRNNLNGYLPNYLTALTRCYERLVRPGSIEDGNISLPTADIVQLKALESRGGVSAREGPKFLSEIVKDCQRLVITGVPGAGKSTFLQWVAYTYAKRLLISPQEQLPIPVYSVLKWYQGNPLDEFIVENIVSCINNAGVPCDREGVRPWLQRAGFLFLFDGLDEIRYPAQFVEGLQKLMGLPHENRFVVTSRNIENTRGLQDLEFEEVEIDRLSDQQVELFIERYLGPAKSRQLLDELDDRKLLTEARNPLFLWLMVLESQAKRGQISRNKGMLLKNVIENQFLKRWESSKRLGEKIVPESLNIELDRKIQVLSALAFCMVETGNGDSMAVAQEDAEEIIDRLLDKGRPNYRNLRDDILEQLLLHGILEKHGSEIGFWNKNLRDYFAALKLKAEFSNEPDVFVKRYATKRWEDSIRLLAGIMENPADLIKRLIKPFWRYFFADPIPFKLWLAAECVGASDKVSSETEQKVIEILRKFIKIGVAKQESWRSTKFMAQRRPSSAFQFCRKFVADSLRPLGVLLAYLLWFPGKDKDISSPILALGEMRSEKAADLLGELLESHDYKVCDYKRYPDYPWSYPPCTICLLSQPIVEALRCVPLTQRAERALLNAALWHVDPVVRNYATEILGKSTSPQVFSELRQILDNDSGDVELRKRAVYTLRGCFNVFTFRDISRRRQFPGDVIDTLARLALYEKSDDLRLSARSTLGHYQGKRREEIEDRLIFALQKDPDPKVRANAAEALSLYFSSKVQKALIQSLDDENSEVRGKAAHILPYMQTETLDRRQAASQLSKLFQDEDLDVKLNAIAAYGLVKASASQEIAQLVRLLKDDSIVVRGCAAQALGRLKVASALDTLAEMAEHEAYDYPLAYAIWAKRQIDPTAAPTLQEKLFEMIFIGLLYDDSVETRKHAVFMLRRIGTEQSLPYLKELEYDFARNQGMDDEVGAAIWHIEKELGVVADPIAREFIKLKNEALAEAQRGRHAESLRLFWAAYELYPTHQFIRIKLAELSTLYASNLIRERRYQEVVDALLPIKEKGLDIGLTHAYLCQAYMFTGRLDEAMEEAEEAINWDSRDASFRILLAEVYVLKSIRGGEDYLTSAAAEIGKAYQLSEGDEEKQKAAVGSFYVLTSHLALNHKDLNPENNLLVLALGLPDQQLKAFMEEYKASCEENTNLLPNVLWNGK